MSLCVSLFLCPHCLCVCLCLSVSVSLLWAICLFYFYYFYKSVGIVWFIVMRGKYTKRATASLMGIVTCLRCGILRLTWHSWLGVILTEIFNVNLQSPFVGYCFVTNFSLALSLSVCLSVSEDLSILNICKLLKLENKSISSKICI